jgi:hypothetical protein
MPVCHLKSKSSGAPTLFAPRSIDPEEKLPTSVRLKAFVVPGARSPPPPPEQVGPVEEHTSTVWKLGKVALRKESKMVLVSLMDVALGSMLNPTAVRRPEGNRIELVLFTIAIDIVNVVAVKAKFENVTAALSGAGPPVMAVDIVSVIVNALEPVVTTFAPALPAQPSKAKPAVAVMSSFFIRLVGTTVAGARYFVGILSLRSWE